LGISEGLDKAVLTFFKEAVSKNKFRGLDISVVSRPIQGSPKINVSMKN
jgi:hypothetical protein